MEFDFLDNYRPTGERRKNSDAHHLEVVIRNAYFAYFVAGSFEWGG